MRERAKQNKLFSYIKIPQVIVRLSYKGSKEKNFEDITNVCLTVPNLEYHNGNKLIKYFFLCLF